MCGVVDDELLLEARVVPWLGTTPSSDPTTLGSPFVRLWHMQPLTIVVFAAWWGRLFQVTRAGVAPIE